MVMKDHSDMNDYEIKRFEYLKTIYCNEWVKINILAVTNIKIAFEQYDGYEKEIVDTQERAFWDLHTPMSPSIIWKIPLDYEKLLQFKELTDWDEDKIIDAYIQNVRNS